MAKLVMDENHLYYLANEKGENILPKKYDNIEIQKYGIVAKNSVEGTFLDRTYDFYDINGKFLFTQYHKYEPNWLTNYTYYFNENYITECSVTTADYDKWDHGSTYSTSYLHFDGSYFNIPGGLKFNNIHKNIAIFESKKNPSEIYYYDIEKKQVVFSFEKFFTKINDMINELNDIFDKKLRILVIKEIYSSYKKAIKQYPINKRLQSKVKNELLKELKDYFKYNTIADLDGYDRKSESYYCNTNCLINEMKNVNFVIDKINDSISELRYKKFKCHMKVYTYRPYFHSLKQQLIIKLLKDTNITTLDDELKKFGGHWNETYGEYIDLKLFEINLETDSIKINKNNVAKFNKYYEKITCKKSSLTVNDFVYGTPIEKETKDTHNNDNNNNNEMCL